MPKRNQIELHPDRLSIELARLAGLSLDAIAEKYGVHRDAIARHMAKLEPSYKAALAADVPIAELAARAVDENHSLFDYLAVLRAGLMQAILSARANNDHFAHAALAKQAMAVLEAIGRLTGDLRHLPSVANITNNVAVILATLPSPD